jgi:cell division protein FtsB
MQNNIENILKNITPPAQSTMDFKFHTPKKMRKSKSKIAAYDINGYLIKTYDKTIDCIPDGFNATAVTKCIKGKRKLHNNFIFIRYGNNEEPRLKIDSAPYKIRKNSRKHKNLQILKTISEELNNKPKEKFYISKRNRTRLGMFEKDGTLFKVFLTTKEFEDYDYEARYAAYRQVYGRYNKKLKKGYKNKYHFRRLEIGKTYVIGQKYNLDDIPFDTQKVFVKNSKNKNTIPIENLSPVQNLLPITTITSSYPEVEHLKSTVQELKNSIEQLKAPAEEPKKKNFLQRLVYLFVGE